MKVYTGYIRFDRYSVEEIDIAACDKAEARKLIKRRLREGYDPGGKIIRIIQRVGWYL